MFDQVNHEAVDAYYRSEYYSSITGPLVNFVNNLSLTLISVLGAVLFLFGRMSAGRISSFVLYSRKFSGPINEAANILSELQSALAAAERVFAVWEDVYKRQDYGSKTVILHEWIENKGSILQEKAAFSASEKILREQSFLCVIFH